MKFLKVFSFVFLVLLVVSSPMLNLGFAKTKPTEKDINKYLQKAGYPEEVIAILEQPQKEYIYEGKLVYSFHKSSNGNLKEKDDKSNLEVQSGDVSTQSLSNWTQTLVASRFSTPSGPGKIEFNLDYNWTWNYDPYFTLMDKFGITWSGGFLAYPESAVYSYRAYGQHVSSTAVTYREYSTGMKYNYTDYISSAGIGFEYDIIKSFVQSNTVYGVYKHKGWGRVKIYTHSDNSGTYEGAAAAAAYFHKELNFTGELQYGTPPSITISPSIAFDKSNDVGEVFDFYNYRY